MRGGIFFYDLADHALSSTLVICIMRHSRRMDEQVQEHLLAAHGAILRDAASCHNSDGFLATPYAG
jgi:hypothetical protein